MPRPAASLAALLAAATLLPLAAPAQQPAPAAQPTLNEVLDRLSQDSAAYQAFVPNFFCDQHVVSQQLKSGIVSKQATLDSNFRVVRNKTGANHGQLVETAEPKLLNGKPTTKEHINLPIVFNDAFTSAVETFFSDSSRGCYTYKLVTPPTGPIEVDFTVRDEYIPMVAQCGGIAPGTTGKALVDRTTLHAIHVDRAHPDMPSGKGANSASVDFATVLIGADTFYLPSTVEARAGTPAHGYLYRATYSNCHKLTVTTTISVVPDPGK